ncbi:hypothetical protein [Phenylobacterium sp.]|uniref:hypothetical protein n=1 Tax=Phenylobacterium sp. TaxID=1871053 RepID=UPI003BAB03F7
MQDIQRSTEEKQPPNSASIDPSKLSGAAFKCQENTENPTIWLQYFSRRQANHRSSDDDLPISGALKTPSAGGRPENPPVRFGSG